LRHSTSRITGRKCSEGSWEDSGKSVGKRDAGRLVLRPFLKNAAMAFSLFHESVE
jgi:hypothetical protein